MSFRRNKSVLLVSAYPCVGTWRGRREKFWGQSTEEQQALTVYWGQSQKERFIKKSLPVFRPLTYLFYHPQNYSKIIFFLIFGTIGQNRKICSWGKHAFLKKAFFLYRYILFNIFPTIVDVILAIMYFVLAFNYIFGIITFMCMLFYLG